MDPAQVASSSMPEPSRIAMPHGTVVVPEAASDSNNNLKGIPSSTPSPIVHGKRTAIFIQDECLKHRFIRSRDTTGIFERPERLHAVKLGLAAAISRIEDVESATPKPEFASATTPGTDEGDLAAALARMAIAPAVGPAPSSTSPSPSPPLRTASVMIRRTSASVSLLDHAAVKYIHGDIDRDVYLENLITWARDSQANITKKEPEIPNSEGITPLDLYRQYFCAILWFMSVSCSRASDIIRACRLRWSRVYSLPWFH